jgi:hypothetical protein
LSRSISPGMSRETEDTCAAVVVVEAVVVEGERG